MPDDYRSYLRAVPGKAEWEATGTVPPQVIAYLRTEIDAPRQMEVTLRFDVTPEQEHAYHRLSPEARLALGAQFRALLDAAVQAEQEPLDDR